MRWLEFLLGASRRDVDALLGIAKRLREERDTWKTHAAELAAENERLRAAVVSLPSGFLTPHERLPS
jgi:hypothetical protein